MASSNESTAPPMPSEPSTPGDTAPAGESGMPHIKSEIPLAEKSNASPKPSDQAAGDNASEPPTKSEEAAMDKSGSEPPTKSEEAAIDKSSSEPPTKSEAAIDKSGSEPPTKSEEAAIDKSGSEPPAKSEEAAMDKSSSKPPTKSEEAAIDKSGSEPPTKSEEAAMDKSSSESPIKSEEAAMDKSGSEPPTKSDEAAIDKSGSEPPTKSEEAAMDKSGSEPPTKSEEAAMDKSSSEPPTKSEAAIDKSGSEPPTKSEEAAIDKSGSEPPTKSEEAAMDKSSSEPPTKSEAAIDKSGSEPPTKSEEAAIDKSSSEPPTKSEEAAIDKSGGEPPTKSEEAAMDKSSSEPPRQSEQASTDESIKAPAPAEWEDVLGSGNLKKLIVTAGKGVGSRPKIGAMITVTWHAEFVGNQAVEDVTKQFILGDGDVPQVYDLTCALMEEGEEAKVQCAPQFYYGDKGWVQNKISPKAHVEIEIKLDQVHGIPDFAIMPISERLTLGVMKRERGNWLYTRSERHEAISVWIKALNVLDLEKRSGGHDDAPEVLQEMLECRAKILANMAAAQIQMEAYDAAIKSAQEAINLQPAYFKAYYRLGKAHSSQGNYEEAIRVLKKALQHDPDQSRLIHDELARLTKLVKTDKETQRQIYSKMFGLQNGKQTNSSKNKPENVSKWMWVTGGLAAAAAVGVGLYKFYSQ